MTFVRRFGILILGSLFLAGGAIGYAAFFPRPSFGWTAYAPLTHETFVPHSNTYDYFLGPVALGLVLVAGWVGHRIGSRTRRVSPR